MCKLCLAIVVGACCLRRESQICSCSLEEQKKEALNFWVSFYIKFNLLLKRILVRDAFSIVYAARKIKKKKK